MAAVAGLPDASTFRPVVARQPSLSAVRYETNRRRRVLLMGAVAILIALALSAGLLRFGPGVVAAPVTLFMLAAIIWQPRIGVFVVLAMVLLFEMNSPDVLMLPGRYINYGLQSSLGISGFIASPLELLLIFTTVVWFVKGVVQHRLNYTGGDLGWPMALFFVAVLAGLLRGASGGGDMYVAFWEARSLLYVGACYLLAVNLVRTRKEVAAVVGVFLIANGLYAFEGAFRYLLLIRTGILDIPQEFEYAHEVVIFLSVLVLQAVLQLVIGGKLWMRMLGILLGPIALFTLFATQRRAGYIALAIAFIMMTIPWIVRHRKALVLIMVPSALAVAIYLPIFWNNTGFLGQPARAVRSMYSPDARDASSNEYRDLEEINVRETIRRDPFLGVGFGKEFDFVVPLPDLSWWPFWRYQPHHNILWVWLKTGAPGFTVFWMVMFGSLALAASRALTLSDRSLVTFAYLSIASVVTTLIFCYVDLGLTNGRVTVFLGMILGVLAGLRVIDAGPGGEPINAPVVAAEPAPRPPRPWSRTYTPPTRAGAPSASEPALAPTSGPADKPTAEPAVAGTASSSSTVPAHREAWRG